MPRYGQRDTLDGELDDIQRRLRILETSGGLGLIAGIGTRRISVAAVEPSDPGPGDLCVVVDSMTAPTSAILKVYVAGTWVPVQS